jgi:hypothetical protein
MTRLQTHQYVWCPRDDHGDHEIHLTYTITPYDPGCTYGPPENCYPPEGGEVEIISASEGGMPRELSPHEDQMARDAIFQDHEWDDGQPDEAAEWRGYDADC